MGTSTNSRFFHAFQIQIVKNWRVTVLIHAQILLLVVLELDQKDV